MQLVSLYAINYREAMFGKNSCNWICIMNNLITSFGPLLFPEYLFENESLRAELDE